MDFHKLLGKGSPWYMKQSIKLCGIHKMGVLHYLSDLCSNDRWQIYRRVK